jgi:hypothetical protein
MRPLAAHCHRGLGLLYCQSGRVEQARLPYLPRSSYTAPWIWPSGCLRPRRPWRRWRGCDGL